MTSRDIVVVDPPWTYKTYSKKGAGRTASSHYNVLTKQDLKDLAPNINEAFPGDSIMCMWVTSPNLDEGIELLKTWGYTYKTVVLTWIKVIPKYIERMKKTMEQNNNVPMTEDEYLQSLQKLLFTGLGHYSRANAEFVLLGTKGTGKIERVRKNIHSVVIAPVTKHSEKPFEANKRIELLLRRPQDRMIELFARRQYNDWYCTGLELDKLDIREGLQLIGTPLESRIKFAELTVKGILDLQGVQDVS